MWDMLLSCFFNVGKVAGVVDDGPVVGSVDFALAPSAPKACDSKLVACAIGCNV